VSVVRRVDLEVEPTNVFGIGHQVDLDDLPVPEGEVEDDARP